MTIVTPAKILAYYLVSVGAAKWYVNANTVWPVTWSKLPDDTPIKRLALFDTGKVLLGAYQRTGGTPQKPLVQVRIRCEETKYDEGWAKGESLAGENGIFDLVKDAIVTVGTDLFKLKSVRVYIPLTPIGQAGDRKDWHFTVNVRLHITGA